MQSHKLHLKLIRCWSAAEVFDNLKGYLHFNTSYIVPATQQDKQGTRNLFLYKEKNAVAFACKALEAMGCWTVQGISLRLGE